MPCHLIPHHSHLNGSMKKLLLFLLLASLVSKKVNAQTETDFQLWMNYALTVRVNDKLSFGGDAGLRGLISNDAWNQILIRPTVTYRFNRTFSAAGAIALFSTYFREDNNVHEFRIHQDFNASWPDFGVLRLFYRLRIEQRFFFYSRLEDQFKVRVRYLIGAESQDIKFANTKRSFYFQFIFEGFKTLFDESAYEVFIHNTRTHAAYGHRISPKFRYELHYIWQKSRRFSDEGLELSQNIFRIRIFHRIPFKKEG